MKSYIYKFLSLFALITCLTYGQEDITMDQLIDLKNKGLLSQEDFEILSSEINGTLENEQLYKLTINGVLATDRYKVLIKGEDMYFPLFNFFETLNFFNLKNEDEVLTVSVNDGPTIEIDKKLKIIKDLENKAFNKEIEEKKDYLFEENGELFLRHDVFKSIYLKALITDINNPEIRMVLNFNTPEELGIIFNVRKDEIKEELEKNELFYTNERKLYELGNGRLQLFQNFDKSAGKDKYEKSWEGKLEYQGALLYGNLTTSYDLETKELNDFEIQYNEIYKNHDLKIGSYHAGNETRELGFSLRKDKGYFEIGKQFVITENVPIGSKVELLYMGYPIEAKEAENGEVIFDNPLIKSDRSYQLKIYNPNGDIETKYINTAQDFNQQNKGQTEYNILFREHHPSDKYKWDANVYYGLSDEFTLGIGNNREVELKDSGYEYLDEGRLELTYSNQIQNNKYPLTVRVGTDQTLTSGEDDSERSYDDRYSYDGMVQLGVGDFSFKAERDKFGKFYDEKTQDEYSVIYKGLDPLTLEYEYLTTEYRGERERESESIYTINYDKGLTDSLLFSAEAKISDKNEEEYRADFFYTGFEDFNVSWRNTWIESISNYETELEVYSNNYFGVLDYSFSVSYSEKQQEKVSFNFDLDYENFLKVTGRAGDDGSRNLKVGIDRIVDLKNIRKPLESMDTSRVKVISFIDGNDNDIYDDGERRVDNVEVKIGNQEEITDELGEARFFGVPNDILLNLKPEIRRPSYSLGNNVIKIKGIAASTIEAYIPVKPMLTLSGKVELDNLLTLEENQKQSLFNDILIIIKDINGKEVEVTMPDENGEFYVSGIFPDKYFLDIKYLGANYNIPELNENLELVYIDNSSPKIVINVGEDKFSLSKYLRD